MSATAKILITVVLLAMAVIPGIDEVIALPVIAALGYIWGFAPTKS